MAAARGERAAIHVSGVRITHPDRMLFEGLGLTKGALARYYADVADWLLPELRGRPLSLVRCPQGPAGGCFYQKNIDDRFAAEIERVPVDLGGGGVYAAANSVEAVLGLVQMGVIELHTWGSTTEDLERPDRMIFDLDPDPAVPFREVVAAAHDTRARLEDLGLESFPKTTGGKGLHVVVPIERKADWAEVKAFCRAFAEAMARDEPGRYLAKASKKQREGRIYVDWLRNAEGATAVAAYSVRARPGATVSTPLHWDEVVPRLDPASFHAGNVIRRLRRLRTDPWKTFRSSAHALRAPLP